MENKNISDLTELIKQIEANEILLPDFQREFVWKDVEQQKQLVASVLARMPIGSILLLQSSNPKEFSSKALGRKQKIKTSTLSHNVEYLLDGQQRMTVLTNVFSNAIFQGLTSVNDLVAPVALKRRFFIKLPKWKTNDDSDTFGFHDLKFPTDNLTDNPTYLSGDIMPNLEDIDFNKNDGKVFNPFTPEEKVKPNDLAKFCIARKDYYLIPLYLIASNDNKNGNKRSRIKEVIKADYISDMQDYYDSLSKDEQRQFIIKYEDAPDEDSTFKDIIGVIFETWWSNFKRYLTDCITKIMMNQIVVSEAQRGRAIDIYENLNRGGVSLNTFDLLTAKVAVVNKDGLYQRLIKHIQEPTKINKNVVPECMIAEVTKLEQTRYNASLNLGCHNENNNTIAPKYLNAFLDIISLRCYNPNFIPSDFKLDYLKQDKILDLSPEKIDENVAAVCEGIDRACYFLQTRCGIRKLSEVNNLFILVLLACIFIKNEWFEDKKVHDLLEAWYWCVIFSGEFDKDQNKNFIKNIQLLVKTIGRQQDTKWLKEMRDKILNVQDYSDKKLLLYQKVDNERYPKRNLADYICQFLLSKPYSSMFDNEERISVFSEKKDSADTALEAHHIIPLGSVKKIKEVTRDLRKDVRSIYNSPLNFIYITRKDNNAISDKSINEYIHLIKPEAKSQLMLTQFQNDQYSKKDVEHFLSDRFDRLQGDIRKRVGDLLAGIG